MTIYKKVLGGLVLSLIALGLWAWSPPQPLFSAPAEASLMQSASDVQWRVLLGPSIDTLRFHNLSNDNHSGVMTYGSREYGINLVWKTNTPATQTDVFFFENCTRPGDPIYGSDLIAIRVSRGPRDTAYFTYGTRSNGIDMVWAEERACEFRFVNRANADFAASGAADGGFAIYNTRKRAYLVYGVRDRGINLQWRTASPPVSVQAKADLVPIRLRWVGGQAVVTVQNQGNVPTTQARNEIKFKVASRIFTKVLTSRLAPGDSKDFVYALSGLSIEDCQPVTVQVDVDRVFQSGSGVFNNDLVTLQANAPDCAQDIVMLQQGALPTTNYQNMADVTIAQALPDMPLANPSRCFVDGDDPPTSGNDLVSLLRWDLSNIPRESIVTSVSLGLYVTDESQDTFRLYPLWSNWSEENTTWRQMDLRPDKNYDSTPVGELRPTTVGLVSAPLNSAGVEAVQSWVQESSTNAGLLLMNSTAIDGMDFACREEANPSLRPALAVRYRLNGQNRSMLLRPVADMTISQALPDASIGGRSGCHADGDDPPGSGNDLSTLLRWDLSLLPKNRAIESAHIVLHITNPSQDAYYLYAVGRNWGRNASWLQATESRAWVQPGGDVSGGVLGQFNADESGRAVLPLNSAGLAALRSWIDQPQGNDGFILRNPSAVDGLDFACSETRTAQNRPILVVEFK